MKKLTFFLILLSNLFSYDIKEFVTCKDVKALTPINITTTFTTKDKKSLCFCVF